jgi:hypothetical protein
MFYQLQTLLQFIIAGIACNTVPAQYMYLVLGREGKKNCPFILDYQMVLSSGLEFCQQ